MKGETVVIIALSMLVIGGGAYLLWRNFSGRGRNQKYNEAYQRGEVSGPVIPDEIYRMIYNEQ